jgi:hypothetical protein
MSDDAGTDGRWLTYDELAALRGIRRIGAVRLVQRYKWRRQAGNDGKARILVPRDALTAPARAVVTGISAWQHDTGNDARRLLPAALAALEGALMQARETAAEADGRAQAALVLADRLGAQLADAGTRADEANKRADAAEARSEANVQRADRAEARAEQAEGECDRIAGELSAAVEQRTAAQAEARLLREAENARQQLGRWRRAWRGWRGR